jgi:hypothetical protein
MKCRVRFVSLLVLAAALVGGCSTRSERERILNFTNSRLAFLSEVIHMPDKRRINQALTEKLVYS